MKLTIVIPALNEEEAIASIIERCLAARQTIIARSPVDAVEIIVVSDGSTDRTAEIAAGYEDIRLIVFERNRGYGAAIKRGFEEGSGELVGFLDADGTCDPRFFADLVTALIDEEADVALGSRMGPESRMPRLRRLGNRIYALILSALSNKIVTDTASGMRVIRRDALPKLYPLPDGLHFTPAMSARVLMDDRLRIVERNMPYEERIGTSKLSVFKDGLRFLRTILEMTLMWRPARVFFQGALLAWTVTILFAVHPIEMWMRTGRLHEDMIYRLLFCFTLGALGSMLLSAALVSNHVERLIDRRDRPPTFWWSMLDRLHSGTGVLATGAVVVPVLIWLVGEGVWTWLTAGYVTLHWSRVVLAGLILFGYVQMMVTGLVIHVIAFHARRACILEKAQADEGRIVTTRSGTAPVPTTAPSHASLLPETV
ncbi:MAG: glycosyltransferase family 2 protein [Planctomycetota bacterium]|nr:MAG: glycosyltransferase family 2 protein [Planctomycetota bacterium]